LSSSSVIFEKISSSVGAAGVGAGGGGGGGGGLSGRVGGGAGAAAAGGGVSTFFFAHAAVAEAITATNTTTLWLTLIKLFSCAQKCAELKCSLQQMDRLLEATARAERDHFWFHGFRRFVAPLLQQAAVGHSAPAILDCGCGTGNNLAMLRKYGHAVGIDLTFSGLQYATSRGDRAVAQASATHLPFPSTTFDIVTSFDVVYALPDEAEKAAVAEMFRVLRPGGHLVLNVAALESLRGNHSVLGGEVRRYTTGRLRWALERGGFEIRRLTYTNATILPLVAATRWLQRIRGHQESASEITVPAAPVNAALTALLSAESLALQFVNMPLGSSVLCLSRRPLGS
jgi:ubiquinone/menaquinone biosynthesis C-methylase UbiE